MPQSTPRKRTRGSPRATSTSHVLASPSSSASMRSPSSRGRGATARAENDALPESQRCRVLVERARQRPGGAGGGLDRRAAVDRARVHAGTRRQLVRFVTTHVAVQRRCSASLGPSARLFDEHWYVSRYPDVRRKPRSARCGTTGDTGAVMPALAGPFFDPGWYVDRYPMSWRRALIRRALPTQRMARGQRPPSAVLHDVVSRSTVTWAVGAAVLSSTSCDGGRASGLTAPLIDSRVVSADQSWRRCEVRSRVRSITSSPAAGGKDAHPILCSICAGISTRTVDVAENRGEPPRPVPTPGLA